MSVRHAPPRLAERFLRWLVPSGIVGESIVGDAREEFHAEVERAGPARAYAWYWIQLIRIGLRYARWPSDSGWNRRLERSERTNRLVNAVPDVLQDVRYAMRTLARMPGFTVVTVVTLALGIGANTAIFSVVNGVMLKPLPYDDPDDLVAVWHRVPSRGTDRFYMSAAMFLTYSDEHRVFEDIGMWTQAQLTMTGAGEPERVDVIVVTDRILPILRVQPILGRLFSARDDAPGAPPTIVLSYRYWQTRFGAAPDVVGRTVRTNGVEAEIIGVMSQDFRFLDSNPAIYFPFRLNRATIPGMGGGFGFQGIARLRSGVTLEDANRDLSRMLPLTVEKFPGRRFSLATLEEWGMAPNLIPLKRDVVGDIGKVLWVLLGTVSVVLIIACANVANLLLVRAEGRQREVAVRTALGAAHGRITRQFLVESVVLGMVGGGLALGLAYGGVRLVLRLAPDNLPRAHEIAVDPTVLLWTLGVSLLTSLAFGLIPALHYGSPDLAMVLKEGGRGSSDGRDRHRTRYALAVSEVGLALVLLIGSGLMIRSFQALRNVRPGFERPEEVLTLRLTVPSAEAREPEDAARVHEEIVERLRAVPGVSSVAAVSAVTLDQRSPSYATYVEGFPVPESEFPPSRRYKWIAGDYFGTMENRVLAGRGITWDDIHNRTKVVVVTENFAREFWGEPNSAVGKHIRNNPRDPWREVVGVVGNVHDDGMDQDARAVIYWPHVVEEFDGSDVFVRRTMGFAIRTTRPRPMSLVPEVREAVWSIDPNLPLADVRTLDDLLAKSMARTSFTLIMLVIAAIAAVILGTVGIYGVISYVVAQRTKEIGVRIALGARQRDVSRLVLRQGGIIALIGVMLGLGGAIGMTRLMSALLYGVSPADPLTYIAAAVTVAIVSLLASYVPARRASSVDPMNALRME